MSDMPDQAPPQRPAGGVGAAHPAGDEAHASDPSAPSSAPRPNASELFEDVQSGLQAASTREPYGWFAGATLAFMAIWLLWFGNGQLAFWRLKLWSIFIVVSGLLVLAPMLRRRFGLSDAHAAQIATGGAGGLVFAWVAFLLPNIASNEAFFGTLCTACAALAAWLAPGRSR